MTLLSLSRQLRTAIERQDEAEFERLRLSYASMVDRLEGDIDALSRDIADGEYTPRSVQRLDSYRRLLRNSERELEEYGGYLLEELAITAGLWLGLGASHSDALLSQAVADAGLDGEFAPMDDEVIASLNRYLAPGSPLYERLQEYGETQAERIRQIILQSVTLGLNPRELARRIVAEGFGIGLTDALRMARTLQLYAYREATLANYRLHSDIVQGWVWSSALIPGRSCMSCVNMHGSIHTLDETLNDHHNGLCAMIPYLGGKNPVKEAGEAWFSRQSAAIQRQMMGPGKYEAWMAGKFSFDQLTTTHIDDVYGEMRHERSLRDLVGAT
jgi:hypothetical protein